MKHGKKEMTREKMMYGGMYSKPKDKRRKKMMGGGKTKNRMMYGMGGEVMPQAKPN